MKLEEKWGSLDKISGVGVRFLPIMITPVSDLNRAEWTPTLPEAEQYNVFAWWRQYSDRATNSPYKITHDGGTTTVAVNQQANGAKWNLLGIFAMTPSQGHKVTLTDEANGNLVADAVQITPVDAPQPSATWTPTIVNRAPNTKSLPAGRPPTAAPPMRPSRRYGDMGSEWT